MGQETLNGQFLSRLWHGTQINKIDRLFGKPGRLQIAGKDQLRLRQGGSQVLDIAIVPIEIAEVWK